MSGQAKPDGKPTVSFEFFPPKTLEGEAAFWPRVANLAAEKPAFMTITYGAGGSERDKTIDMAIRIADETNIPTAAHLTFICTPKDKLREIADRLWDNNVRHIIALRGDLPKEKLPEPGCVRHFNVTSEFVKTLKEWHPFEISVGAYPEKHPAAPDAQADLDALRLKCDAGADRAITQFFFDNDLYYRFLDKVAQQGIRTPIVPGILPIVNFKKMLHFANMCHASVPGWLVEQFEAANGNEDEMHARAEEILLRQVSDLAAQGVDHFHFYTLNHDTLPLKACRELGVLAP